MYDELHAPLIPILRHALAHALLSHQGLVLDLACGDGAKVPLLRDMLGPGVQLLGLDLERSAAAPLVFERRRSLQSVHSSFVCGDAHCLPLRDGCLDGALCIAALGAFREPLLALRELRRALKPQAAALFVTAEYAWVSLVPWPADLAALLTAAMPDELFDGLAADVADGIARRLAGAGFGTIQACAFLLRPASDVRSLRLPLLSWADLRPLVAHIMPSDDLVRCDEVAAQAEIELVEVAMIVLARNNASSAIMQPPIGSRLE